MTRLHIIRHGESEWNLQKKVQGQNDSPLTSLGRKQAIAAKEKITDKIDIVFSSPSLRAIETANIITSGMNVHVIKADELMEMNLSIWEGRTLDEIERDYPNENKNFWENPDIFTLKNAETFSELQIRAINYILNVLDLYKKKTIVIISHTITIYAILTYFLGHQIKDIWKQPYLKNCSHIIIDETTTGIFKVVFNN